MGWDSGGWKLTQENPDIVFRAPKSGALGWVDTFAIPAKARNVDAAYRSLMDETPDTSDCSESIAARFVDVDDPDRSYLLHKMSDAEIPRAERPICGDPMPDGEPPLVLGAAKVRAWIEQGALR